MEAETDEKDPKKKKHERNVDTDKSTPEPIDKDFTTWTVRLFRDNERAERIVVQQLLGKSANINGEIIKTHIFKEPEKQPSHEELVYVSNELLDEMQAEADSLHRSRTFAVIAYNAKKGGAFARRTVSLDPKRINLAKANGHDSEDDDELSPFAINGTDMLQERFKSAQADNRWLFEQMSGALGGTMASLLEQNREKDQMIRELFRANMDLAKQKNDVENNALDRELIREREKIKLELQRKGINFVAGLLPGAVSKMTNGKVNLPGGRTAESMTIESVVESLSDKEKEYVFGDWENGVRKTPGLLSETQTKIIATVQDGADPAQLDQLLSGDHQLSQDQLVNAQMSGQLDLEKLIPLMKMLQDRKEKLVAAQSAGKGS